MKILKRILAVLIIICFCTTVAFAADTSIESDETSPPGITQQDTEDNPPQTDLEEESEGEDKTDEGEAGNDEPSNDEVTPPQEEEEEEKEDENKSEETGNPAETDPTGDEEQDNPPEEPPTPPEVDEDSGGNDLDVIDSYDKLQQALSEKYDNIYLDGDIAVDETIVVDYPVTISGGSLTRVADVSIIEVTSSGNLTLSGVYLYGSTEAPGRSQSPIVCDGSLVLDGGTTIDGFYASNGGAITVNGNLTMYPGVAISNNTAQDLLHDDRSYSSHGGGVFVAAGGSFDMLGGYIENNSALSSDRSFGNLASGGGVAVESGGYFSMSGGTISGNSAIGRQASGGGICVGDDTHSLGTGGTVVITGGTIENNTTDGNGGGMYVHNGATATVYNATVVKNSAHIGGGLWFCVHGSMNMEDSVIVTTDNTASSFGADFVSECGRFLSIGDTTTTGDIITWYQDCGSSPFDYTGEPLTDIGTWVQDFFNWSEGWEDLGLRSETSYTETATVFKNNDAIWGGGIACNGVLEVEGTTPPPPKEPEPEYTSVSVSKEWIGNTIPEDAAIIVELYQDGTLYRTQELSDANNWQYTFEDLPEEYTYTVREVSEYEGWIPSITQNGNDFKITNTYPTISIDVTKEWVGNSIPEDIIVTVVLYKDGEVYDELELNANNEWKGTFTDLPDDGSEYTVAEVTVDGWDSAVTGSVEEGYVITNTYIPPPPPPVIPRPDPDPEPPPPDEETPPPEEEETPPPPPPDTDLEIPDDDVPLDELPPEVEIPEDDVPLTDEPTEPEIEIPEDDVPLDDIPDTGDASSSMALISLLVSSMGLIILRKKDN